MKATSLLESQHRQVAALIEDLERPGADRKALTEKLATAILAHMVIEEEIFYPQAEKAHRELSAHGFEDHESEIPVLLRLAATPAHDERFTTRLSVLKQLLQHHIHEEESFLFPAVNRSFPAEKNAHLGQQMKARFDQVIKGGLVGALKLRVEEAERRAPAGITAIGTCLAESGKERKGQSEKGQSEKGQSEKGQSEKGQSEKGQSEKGQAEKGRGEKGRSQRGQSEKGQSQKGSTQKGHEKGQAEKGQSEKGRSGKGRSERRSSEQGECEEEESMDSVDEGGSESGPPSSEKGSARRAKDERDESERAGKSEDERRTGEAGRPSTEQPSKEKEEREASERASEPAGKTS